MNKVLATAAVLVAAAAVFLLGGYVEYSAGVPFAAIFKQHVPLPSAPLRGTPLAAASPVMSPVRTDVPIVSRAQGAQDAARADTPMGETVDLQRCYATMIARKLIESEAKTVCAKLIGGISR